MYGIVIYVVRGGVYFKTFIFSFSVLDSQETER